MSVDSNSIDVDLIVYWLFEIKQIYVGQYFDLIINVWVLLIYVIMLYIFDDIVYVVVLFGLEILGNIYIWIGNFIIDVVEQCIVVFEGGVVVLFLLLGQVVEMFVILNLVGVGDYIVFSLCLYGGIYNLFYYLLVKFGIEVSFVDDLDDLDIWQVVVWFNIKVFFVEIIFNLQIDLLDILVVFEVVYCNGVLLIVDNIIVMLYLI